MRIAIQGISGSFHDQAAQEFFKGETIELLELMNFRDVFEAVEDGSADYGLVAIENSLQGQINPVYRLLSEKDLWVHGEVRLHITLHLVSYHKAAPESFNIPTTTVMSHFAALAQCDRWLTEKLPHAKRQEVDDTAEAVVNVVKAQNPHLLAVASAHAAKLHHGVTIGGPINDEPDNYTRFIVIAREEVTSHNANRTSLILTEGRQDTHGALYNALGAFAKANINLSKLDSHPTPGKLRRYAFYLDADAGLQSEKLQTALTTITEQGWKVRILGSYHTDLLA